MKKFISIILSLLIAVSCFFPICSVAAEKNCVLTEKDSDGYYYVITIENITENENDLTFISRLLNLIKKILTLFRSNNTIQKTKTVCYYDSKDILLWSVSLKGTFTYNGKTSACTAASISYDIFDKNWKLTDSSASKDGASAKAYFFIRQYKLGVPLKTFEKNIILTCDCHGNVS